MDLADDPQAVGFVPLGDVGVHRHRGFELGHPQRFAQPQGIEPVADHVEGAALVQAFAQPFQQRRFGGGAVVLGERFPGVGIGLADPRDHVGRVKGQHPVVIDRVLVGVKPALLRQVLADFRLEGGLGVQVHVAVFASLFVSAPGHAPRLAGVDL